MVKLIYTHTRGTFLKLFAGIFRTDSQRCQWQQELMMNQLIFITPHGLITVLLTSHDLMCHVAFNIKSLPLLVKEGMSLFHLQ